MQQLIKFTLILIVLLTAGLLTLLVAGVLDSSELWNNLSTVLKFAAIGFGASAIILLIAKK